MIEVFAISRDYGRAVISGGEIVPITGWFDGDGEECDPWDAVACAAGPTEEGEWLAIDLAEFSPVVVN